MMDLTDKDKEFILKMVEKTHERFRRELESHLENGEDMGFGSDISLPLEHGNRITLSFKEQLIFPKTKPSLNIIRRFIHGG
jgi:hypothetical protein